MRATQRAAHIPDPTWRPWRAVLRQAIARSGLSKAEVARRAGVSASHISNLTIGLSVPGHEIVVRLAEVLTCDALVESGVALRMAACTFCGNPFLSKERGGNPRRFCSHTCVNASRKRREATGRARDVVIIRHRLRDHQEAILAFCMACEPEGLCRRPRCELRQVSPLPLAKESVA